MYSSLSDMVHRNVTINAASWTNESLSILFYVIETFSIVSVSSMVLQEVIYHKIYYLG